MATSKLPVRFAMVPQAVIDFCHMHPGVHYNRRLEQRPEPVPQFIVNDRIFVEEGMREFLKSLALPASVVMLFQGYGPEKVGTAVIRLESIYWSGYPGGRFPEDYPKLGFTHPPEMAKLHGCPNFWGAFIMAMAEVPYQEFCVPDPEGQEFIRICSDAIRSRRDADLERC